MCNQGILSEQLMSPYLGYVDVIYGHQQSERFSDKMKSIQYNTALVITNKFKRKS